MNNDAYYCSYCDEFADGPTCKRCELRTQSMTPVRDSYLLNFLAAPLTEGDGK